MISVIIPVRNRAWSLENTVRSCLVYPESTVREILIVDNGSTDETPLIATKLTTEDNRVQWMPSPSESPNANRARNRGIQIAKGKYLQFLDSDDLLSPDKLTKQLNLLENAQPKTVSASGWEWLYQSGKIRQPQTPSVRSLFKTPNFLKKRISQTPTVSQAKTPTYWRDYQTGIDLLAKLWLSGGWLYTGCWLIPADLAQSVGGWDETLCADQDGEFFSRVLAASTGGVRFLPSAGIKIFLHGHQQLSDSRLQEAWDSRINAWKVGSNLLREHWQDPRCNKAIKRRLRHIAYVYAGSQRPSLLTICEQIDRTIPGLDLTCPSPFGLAPLISVFGLKKGISIRQRIRAIKP